MSSSRKVMIDSTNSNNLMYLPLDKLGITTQPGSPANTGEIPDAVAAQAAQILNQSAQILNSGNAAPGNSNGEVVRQPSENSNIRESR